MSFTKPSVQTSLTLPYTFKSLMSSTAQNYIDAVIPQCLDKVNGDTITGNITNTGNLTFVGSTVESKSGAIFVFDSGTLLEINSGASALIAGTISILSGGHLTNNSGGTLTNNGSILNNSTLTNEGTVTNNDLITNSAAGSFINSGNFVSDNVGTMNVYGARLTLHDNKPPIFATPQLRVIVQPMIVMPNGAAISQASNIGFPSVTAGYWTDLGTATNQSCTWTMPLSKMINGATLDQVLMPFATTGTAPGDGSHNQRVQLWKTNYNNGTVTQIGSTQTVPDGLGSGTYYPATISFGSGLAEVIDDSIFSYSLVVLQAYGSFAYSLNFGSPVCFFTNITSLRSI